MQNVLQLQFWFVIWKRSTSFSDLRLTFCFLVVSWNTLQAVK